MTAQKLSNTAVMQLLWLSLYPDSTTPTLLWKDYQTIESSEDISASCPPAVAT